MLQNVPLLLIKMPLINWKVELVSNGSDKTDADCVDIASKLSKAQNYMSLYSFYQ